MDADPILNKAQEYVDWFRHSSPYIRAHRGRTLVITFGGEVLEEGGFPNLIHDIALLSSLGIRLVLVHGARPQIEARLRQKNLTIRYHKGLRVTDDDAMACVKEAAASVRLETEALLSSGGSALPVAGAKVRVVSGNFVTASPIGVRAGVDFGHSGEVRRVDADGIRRQLDDGAIVLLSPLGYSLTGEVFNVSAEQIAGAVAAALQADKLICLIEGNGVQRARGGRLDQITLAEAERLLHSRRKLPEEVRGHLQQAVLACRSGVRRAHLISHRVDGALLLELFSRDGIGTLITDETYEGLRTATIEDVGGILQLIEPLEREGVLARRSRERLEQEIEHFIVIERDGAIIASAALYPYPKDRMGELACLVVDPLYRGANRADALLDRIERRAKKQGIRRLFVLTTHTAQWFRERGFEKARIADLPMRRQELYNYQRNSRVYVKRL
ncbi:MAG: amino-acid N-acetyltransferase [Gammaproteobacteria bacterium]